MQGLITANITLSELNRTLAAWVATGVAPHVVPKDGRELDVNFWIEVHPGDLDCPSPRMRRDLLRAVTAERYPSITFWFSELAAPPKLVRDESGAGLEMVVEGYLFLAGESRRTTHTATLRLIDASTVELSGELSLNMKDFGITPPTALMGLLKAHAEFDVAYRFTVRVEAKSTPDFLISIPATHPPSL